MRGTMAGDVISMDIARERERALEHKAALLLALVPVIKVMEDARMEGFKLDFNLGPDNIGRTTIICVHVVKVF